MADDHLDLPGGNGRQSNHDLFRALQSSNLQMAERMDGLARDVQAVCVQLAGIVPSLTAVLRVSEETRSDIRGIVQRADAQDRTLVILQGEVDTLKARPIALSPEDHGDIRTSLRDHTNQLHGIANILQSALTGDELTEARRMLRLTAKYETDRLFTRDESAVLQALIKKQQSGELTSAGRRGALENGLIGAGAGGVVFGFLVPYIQHLAQHVH